MDTQDQKNLEQLKQPNRSLPQTRTIPLILIDLRYDLILQLATI
jgi:hypothetical protein